MAYLIAVASSDEVNVDLTFGAAEGFTIYEVEGTSYRKKEYRQVPAEAEEETSGTDISRSDFGDDGDNTSNISDNRINSEEYRQESGNESNSADVGGNGYGCGGGNEAGCGTGGGCGAGGGCGHGGAQPKVELISDCRSLVCKKIGFQAQKQLEKKQIASFDVSCSVEDALTKISTYFDKLDNHKPYRRA